VNRKQKGKISGEEHHETGATKYGTGKNQYLIRRSSGAVEMRIKYFGGQKRGGGQCFNGPHGVQREGKDKLQEGKGRMAGKNAGAGFSVCFNTHDTGFGSRACRRKTRREVRCDFTACGVSSEGPRAKAFGEYFGSCSGGWKRK